jgi:hypothetical protein
LKELRKTSTVEEESELIEQVVNKELDSLVDEIGDLTLEETTNIKN